VLATILPTISVVPCAALRSVDFFGANPDGGFSTQVLRQDGDEELIDVLLAHRRLHRGPKIVAIGGGTGLSTLLRRSCTAILLPL